MTRSHRSLEQPSWTHLLTTLGVVAWVTASAGCIGGPCVHTYEEDVVFLEDVRNALTDAPLSEVVVTEVRYAGNPLASLSGEGLTALGGGSYRCRLPCSFGSSFEGRYEIDVSADGYEATTIVGDARYAEFQGGCPSSNDGGTRLVGTLTPVVAD